MLRASTSAIGTPSATHNTVLAVAVRRLSASAVRDEGLVISDQKCGQSTFTATASNGSPTKTVPTAAGRYTQRGRSVLCALIPSLLPTATLTSPRNPLTRSSHYTGTACAARRSGGGTRRRRR